MDINDQLARRHFQVQYLGALLKKFKALKNNADRTKIQVGLTNSGLRDLKKEIEDMSEQEKETENPNEIVDIVEMICKFNRQQQGQGLKIHQIKCLLLLDYQFCQSNQKQKIILKNLKMKLGNYFILFTDRKNLEKTSIKV